MIKLTEILQEILNQQQIIDIAKEFMSSSNYNKSHDCKRSTYEFINWLKKNKKFEPEVLLLAPPKDTKKYPGKSGTGDSHIFAIIDEYGVDFTANQFPGISEPLKITPENQIPTEYEKIGGYYTLYPDWFPEETNGGKSFIKTKFNNLPQFFRDGFEKEGFKPDLNESIDKIAGVWDTDEKFKDGSDFKIKFKVSNIIDLAKNTPVKEIDPKSIKYNFSGRQDSDPSKTKERVMKANLSYPIIAVKNEAGKIFAMLDGTHRLEKALNLGLDKIKTKILDKEDLIQFKTDILKEKIDEYNVVNKQDLNELRQSFLNYLKQQLPNTPDYVIQDWIYKMLKQSDNVNTAENIQDWIDNHLKNLKWEYKTNFPMTIDIFNDRTQQELKSRIEGEIRQDVNKDIERHKTQQRLLKSQGISKEPIILMKTKDGKYALGEGWHRTTQSFKMYPKGFTQPSVYIGIGWVDDNKDEVDEYDVENEQDLKEFIVFIKEYKQILSEGCDCLTEAEYHGRKVTLGKPMQGDIKKFKVYVKNNKGKVVKVNFGFGGKSAHGKRMVIKAKNPKRRAAYRARHNCDNPGPRWKANYWSCRKW